MALVFVRYLRGPYTWNPTSFRSMNLGVGGVVVGEDLLHDLIAAPNATTPQADPISLEPKKRMKRHMQHVCCELFAFTAVVAHGLRTLFWQGQ